MSSIIGFYPYLRSEVVIQRTQTAIGSGKTELVQGRLEEAKQRLERISNMAYFEVGYGQAISYG